MDALKNLPPETKISDLTVEQFEAVMTRTFCRVADFAAVRIAQEQMYVNGVTLPSDLQKEMIGQRHEGAKQIRGQFSDENWPEFKTARIKPKIDLEIEA